MLQWFCLELSEDKSLAIGQNADDVAAIADESDQTSFDVKYLGNTPVDSAADAVAEAIKTILLLVTQNNILFLIIFCPVMNKKIIEKVFMKLMYTYSSNDF